MLFPKTLMFDVVNGIISRYPVCCILNFIYDIYVLRKSPSENRNKKFDLSELEWVPCYIHCKYKLKLSKKDEGLQVVIDE